MASEDQDLLRRVVDSFNGKERAGQQKMVDAVASALDEQQRLLVEAGTGTGKSLGYLVPAMRRAVEHSERIVISTATLALQRQILTKDAPQVAAAMDADVDVAVLKGWSNYLCMHKVSGGYPDDDDTLFAPAPSSSTGKQVVRLRAWAEEITTGDRDDLTPGVNNEAWRAVSVNTNQCLGTACPMRAECFPARAREAAAKAQIVVTNHSMLGIHAGTDNRILGEFDALIVDESHDLARVVRDQSARQLAPNWVSSRARRVTRRSSVDTHALEDGSELFNTALESLDEGLLTVRPPELVEALCAVDSQVRDVVRQIGAQPGLEAIDKKLALAALSDTQAFLDAWGRDPERMITWVSRSKDEQQTYLNCAPLDVAGAIAHNLFAERGCVLTSATLKLAGSFTSMARETGASLLPGTVHTLDVGTPFAPEKQGILYVASHLQVPGRSGVNADALTELVELTQAAGGGALALFSSRVGAQEGAAALREALDVPVYVQGEEQLPALINKFAAEEDSCLVGTLSLWQGIDVKGHACRLITIDRIPFPVPSDPVVAARNREVAKRGGNPFRVVSLDHAALLMRQAAGRLLRCDEDRGMVAILDSRVASRGYGKYLLTSLPRMWRTDQKSVALSALRRLNGGN